MNKVLATILLILGSLAAVLAVLFLFYFVGNFTQNYVIAGVAAAAGLLALGFVSSRTAVLFRKKFGFKKPWLILALHIPSAFVGAGCLCTDIILDKMHYYNGYAGLVAFGLTLINIFMIMVYVISGVLFTSNALKNVDF